MKTGRFTVSEINYLYQNAEKMSVDQLAKKLNRDPTSVYNWIKKNIGLTKKDKAEIEGKNELRSRPYYRELQKQFTTEELEMFDYHFQKMWSQFKDDVFHTEEMQIVDTIKLEVLMNRSLRSQQANADQIDQLTREVQREKAREPEDQDRDYIINLERQMAVLRASQDSLSKDFKDLQTKKASSLKELKGTRADRIKEIEDSKNTFASLIKELTMNPAYRREVGLEMEKMRLAMDAEWLRLSQDVKFNDGTIDKPLLSNKSVFVGDEDDDENS